MEILSSEGVKLYYDKLEQNTTFSLLFFPVAVNDLLVGNGVSRLWACDYLCQGRYVLPAVHLFICLFATSLENYSQIRIRSGSGFIFFKGFFNTGR